MIKMMKIIFLIGFIGAIYGASSQKIYHENRACQQIMRAHGLTSRFPGAVAHGIHSITLEDIRYYFNKDATENNTVPTLNYDLNDKEAVLRNARLYGFDTSFYTIGMQHLDQVLMNMDKKNHYLSHYTTLEKIVHTIHMNEVWSRTKVHYDAIKQHTDYGKEICKCVTDIDNNGIFKMLHLMNLKIRYPGITSGLKLGDGIVNWDGNIYQYYFVSNWSKALKKFDFNRDLDRMIEEASTKLADGDKGVKHIDSEKTWSKWKAGMKKMNHADDFELAVFLYCTLEH